VRPVARRGGPGRRGSTSPRWPRRIAVLAALAATLLAAGAVPAAAHPLGNFTTNSYSGLRVGPDRLVVDYVLDLAEIPAFQARQTIDGDGDGRVGAAEAAAWRDRECPRLAGGLRATVDGQALPLRVMAAGLEFPEGVGRLETLRLECALAASLPAGGGTRTLAYTDANQPGRVGWREITAVGDHATLEATDVPAGSASARLSAYPSDQLSSPLDQRTATLRFHPGAAAPEGGSQRGVDNRRPDPGAAAASESGSQGAVDNRRADASRSATLPLRGPQGPGGGCSAALAQGPQQPGSASSAARTRGPQQPGSACSAVDPAAAGPGGDGRGGVDRATAAFTALVGERRLSAGFAAVALLLAVALGAAHALAPGHGKTVMAAYLVGLRGSLRQAATIGATVTITHTAGVLLLGLVLSTSRAVASERLYPWLGLASGLLLAAVGVALLARALTGHRLPHPHEHPHHHDHDHGGHGPAPWPLGRRGLVALGLAGGLVPSPSAVVVLLGGIALGQAWFGVALVLAYGLGMAATLTGVGLLLAHLRTRMDRRLHLPAGSLLARLAGLLPAATASVIVLVGLALATQGAAQL
jgi:nickel/cobalt exporter